MYTQEFCKIYNEYGWDYFSLTFGEAIVKYLDNQKFKINSHLDLACGVGTLCDFFYKKNIQTSGIDISKDMINLAKEKNKNIDFFVEDMINYKTNKKYDLITIACDALNHILEEENIDKIFFNVYNMLNKNGYFIFDICDKNKLKLNENIVSNRENNIKVNYYFTKKEELLNTNIKVYKNENLIFEYNVLERLFNQEKIEKLLKKYKFKIIKIDNKILDETQRVTDKLYFICQK